MTETFIYYPKRFLLEALKKAKLPCTYKTLLKYEVNGVIKRPGVVVSGSKDRYYTLEQINEIVEEVRVYKTTGSDKFTPVN